MARANFYEIFRCAGVDHHHSPPAMVVPLGAANQVVLETSGIELKVESGDPRIRLEEFDGKGIAAKLVELNNSLLQPGVDPVFREAFLPLHTSWHKPRFFRIHGRALIGFPGIEIKAVPVPMPGRRLPLQGSALRVVVLDRLRVPIAIRNVRSRDRTGALVYHARQPCDPKQELANMNAIWNPQANIAFDLVSSEDVVMDHNDPRTREALRKAYGMKEGVKAEFGSMTQIAAETNWEVFRDKKVPGTVMTFFLVHTISGSASPMGRMNLDMGISFIAGSHLPTTFAHEAGHYLGQMWHRGDTKDPNEDMRLLMRGGGSGWKIPFGLVSTFRDFGGKAVSGKAKAA